MGVKSLHTSKILQLVQHIILSFHYLCTIILRNRKTIQYGYQSIEQIPPKGVSFSNFICTFAAPCYDFRLFSNCNTKISENLTRQNPRQLIVAQELINKVKL